jgi:hypothetical protein
MRRFLRGESDLAWFADWLARVRTWTSAGQRIGRVRMLTDPLTDYLRFELFITPPAVDAGERIRFLRAAQADELDLPREDFWMFDDERVVRMTFGQQGVSGAELITEPGTVARYRTWRSAAERASVPLAELRPRV